jgi:hypothetical protein
MKRNTGRFLIFAIALGLMLLGCDGVDASGAMEGFKQDLTEKRPRPCRRQRLPTTSLTATACGKMHV